MPFKLRSSQLKNESMDHSIANGDDSQICVALNHTNRSSDIQFADSQGPGSKLGSKSDKRQVERRAKNVSESLTLNH
jgi:hypothetical protein